MPPRAKLKAPASAAPASGATLEHLPEILRALLSAENESRGVAEATLKALIRDARGQCIAALLRHARGDADASVRQLAAVVLKRKVLAHWSTLPPAHQEEFKNALLEGVVREPVPAVRRAIADVVSKVAKATVPMGAWSALPEFLAQCAQSPEEGHREVAFVLFASLTETIVGTMTRHYATLGNLFQSGLADASLRVRVAALRAALALATNAPEKGSKDETEILRGLVLPVLAVARNAIAAGEEKDASLAFEVLDELVEAQPKALAGRIEDVVAFCVEVAGARDLDAVTRRRALDAVSFLARHKPKALCRAKVVPPLLRALCPLCGEPKESELAGDADVDDEDEAHVQTVAARLVDLLALNAPAKHVLPEVLAFASHAVSDANDDPRLRHAGVAVLGIVAEGCAEGLERAMPQIVPPVVAALRDGSRDVRGAAAFALGQFAECVADATDFHAVVLPAAFAALTVETDARCLERTVYVLDAWLERLEEGDVAPYVKPTLDIAYAAIDGAWAFKTREAVLGAVASAAAAAGTAMHAHLPALLPRLEKCLTASGDDDLRSRARARWRFSGCSSPPRAAPRRWRRTCRRRWPPPPPASTKSWTTPSSASTATGSSRRPRRRSGSDSRRTCRRVWKKRERRSSWTTGSCTTRRMSATRRVAAATATIRTRATKAKAVSARGSTTPCFPAWSRRRRRRVARWRRTRTPARKPSRRSSPRSRRRSAPWRTTCTTSCARRRTPRSRDWRSARSAPRLYPERRISRISLRSPTRRRRSTSWTPRSTPRTGR
jgi:hypothetical protein